jgi:uncharacterized protein (DUF1778 family)
MPRRALEDNNRMSIRIHAEAKAKILRAAALTHTDLTDFVIQHALTAAQEIIEKAESIQLSERDSLMILELLENPPTPNPKLGSTAMELPEEPVL